MKTSALDSHDLQLIHALQIEPRVAWSALQPALEMSSVTLARRWQRITSKGIAWQSALISSLEQGAIVELSCIPGATMKTAEEAAEDPRVQSIDITTGGRDLVLTFAAADAEELADYAIERFGRYDGVRAVHTHVLADVFRLGSQWTVRALAAEQISAIPTQRPPRAGSAKAVPPEIAHGLRDALEQDVRMGFVELGARTGISAQRAADYVARLRGNGSLVLRTDVAGPFSTWPVVSWYFIQAPPQTLLGAEASLAQLPEVQFAASATGQHNLIVALSARSLSELAHRETALECAFPGARIADRSLVLRMHKHLGHRIGADGRALTTPRRSASGRREA